MDDNYRIRVVNHNHHHHHHHKTRERERIRPYMRSSHKGGGWRGKGAGGPRRRDKKQKKLEGTRKEINTACFNAFVFFLKNFSFSFHFESPSPGTKAFPKSGCRLLCFALLCSGWVFLLRILCCYQSDDPPENNLAKFGYILNMNKHRGGDVLC